MQEKCALNAHVLNTQPHKSEDTFKGNATLSLFAWYSNISSSSQRTCATFCSTMSEPLCCKTPLYIMLKNTKQRVGWQLLSYKNPKTLSQSYWTFDFIRLEKIKRTAIRVHH